MRHDALVTPGPAGRPDEHSGALRSWPGLTSLIDLFVDLRDLLPKRADYVGLSRTWRGDVLAGMTVAIVALPLALAFGITTGLGAAAGLLTAIVAGFVAGLFGGSNVQVSGPTGAMAAVLVPIVHRYGADAVVIVGVVAGVLVIVGGLLRTGRYVAYVPWPVVEGFTVGIAVIIGLQQLPSLLGVSTSSGDSVLGVAAQTIRAATRADPVTTGGTLLIAAVVAAVMFGMPRLVRSVPASLAAVIVATAIAEVVVPGVARIGVLPSALPAPTLPALTVSGVSTLFPAAVAIAVLVALESLLSARVADGMVDTGRHDPDRELFGQGLANVAASLFGGMPATGAIARTAVNVRAGARTRVAAMTHSVVLAAILVVGAGLVGRIPLAALAGVLVVTAVRMVDVRNVRSIVRATRRDALVLGLTAILTVGFDLILAVEVGVAVAGILALRAVAMTAEAIPEAIARSAPGDAVDAERESDLLGDRILTYRLDGALFFGAAQRFHSELTAVTDVRVVILRMPQLQTIDATGAQTLGDIIAELESRGITVLLKGPRPMHLKVMRAVGTLDRLAHERHVFATLDEAVAHARTHLGRGAAAD
jgi:SulP family sulfate permease